MERSHMSLPIPIAKALITGGSPFPPREKALLNRTLINLHIINKNHTLS